MASPLELKLTRYYENDENDTINGTAITLVHDYNPKPGDGETDISESIPIFFEGAQATVQSTINSVNQYLADARARAENGYGNRVYLESRAGTAAAWRRSEIIDGRLSIDDSGIRAGLASGLRTPATLSITRRGWFEDTAALSLPLTNSNGTFTYPNYQRVYNCDDGAGTTPAIRNNWISIPSASITGDLPAPVFIKIKLSSGNPIRLYAAHGISYNNNINHTYFYSDQSGTADANCSGGYYKSTAIPDSYDQELAAIVIANSAILRQLGGAPYRLVLRFRDTTSITNVKYQIGISTGGLYIWRSPWKRITSVYTGEIMHEFGPVNIPPGISTSWTNLRVSVLGSRLTSNTETIGIDYAVLFGGEFVNLKEIFNSSISADSVINYGGLNKVIYRDDVTNKACKDIIALGAETLTVVPGVDNIYHFAIQDTGGAAITVYANVGMRYNPRWSTPL